MWQKCKFGSKKYKYSSILNTSKACIHIKALPFHKISNVLGTGWYILKAAKATWFVIFVAVCLKYGYIRIEKNVFMNCFILI